MFMRLMKRPTLYCLLCFGILWLLSPGALQAQSSNRAAEATASDQQVLQALLGEVRQLRLTLQRTNLSVFRAQIMIERLRMQQERVDRLTRQLEENQNEITGSALSQSQLTERSREMESQMKLEQDAGRRSQLEAQYKELKYIMNQQTERETQLRAHQGQLTTQLQAERTKLDDIDSRLEALERELEQPQPANKP
jgi:chromosome segregation ATPase